MGSIRTRAFTIFVTAMTLVAVGIGRAAATDVEDAARALVVQLAAGDFVAATSRFDAKMKAALPVEKLATVWQGLETQAGKFQSVETATTKPNGDFRVVTLGCKFQSMPLDAKVVFDATGNVAGLFFSPQVQPWSPPDYAATDRYEERPVTIDSGRYKLPGVLTVPRGPGPWPAAVLVHGSGPHDADESIGPNKPFRDLAWGLASRGVAVLRYTKRTLMMAQEESPSIAGLTVEGEVLEDARAAVGLLSRSADIDSTRLFVIGHSLGGMLAPRLAAADRRVAGIVILAGNVRPTEELALEQVRWMANRDGKVDEAEQAVIASTQKAVAQIQSPALAESSTVEFLGAPMPGSYWLDLRGYRPDAVAAKLRIPVLVLRGERDYQVGTTDFELWKKALAGKRNATCKLYPGLNHLFIAGTGAPGPEDYAIPGHVAPVVVQDIATWILEKKR